MKNKTDAGNGSKAICRVSNVLRSQSPDPGRRQTPQSPPFDFMNLPPLPSEITSLKEFIHQNALPCIALSLSCDVPTHPRTSKLGGDADLPSGVEWPSHEGEPLGFLLQIVLSEIGFATDFGLPADGILSFFYDLEECPWDPEVGGAFRVLYSPSGAVTEPVCSPEGSSHLPECAIRFRRGASLPYFGSTALGDFEQLIHSTSSSDVSEDDINDCADAYGSFCADVAQHGSESPDGGPHRMFGHPENIQDEMRAHDPEWVLLLQLASDDAVGMSWGDSGMLYFWMTRSDLAAKNFSNVIMTLQCC